jgi:HlyD family secretion protein
MDADKLKNLQIAPRSRQRRQRSVAMIFLGVLVVTALGAYLAWPRKDDARRLFAGPKSKPAEPTNALSLPRAGAPSHDGVVLTVSGYLVNRERIELSPRFLGQVKWIGVRKGDAVTNGQIVVLLDDSEQQARLHEAQSRLASAQVALEKAQIDFARIQKLIADHIETRQNADDLRLRVEAARAAIKETEANVELMQTYLDWTVIRAPIDGVVLEKLADANELVTPQSFGGTRGPSTALIAIADPHDLQVEVELNESDLAKVFLNQKCRVSPEAFPDKSYAGSVAEIAPEANRQKGTLQVKVQIRNPDRYLIPELSAKVDFLAQP